eukprot:GHUV01005396.1.p1 GENE.GHUV01005396.1~~GHUV01005396.1.p1  ORF type:complete len:328 (+),score=99.20 GHUV01005396.1:148-984(+)
MGPAAVSDLVKTVNSQNIGQLVAAMGPELAAAVVHSMGVDLTVDLVKRLGPEVAAGIVRSAGGAVTGALVRAMGADFVAELVTKLGITENVALVGNLGPGVLVSLTTALGPMFIASLSVSLSSELFSAIFGGMSHAGASALGMDARPEGGVPPGTSSSTGYTGGNGRDYDMASGYDGVSGVTRDVGGMNLGREDTAIGGGAGGGVRIEVPVQGSSMTSIVGNVPGGAASTATQQNPLVAGQQGVKIIPAVQLTNNAADVEGASFGGTERLPGDVSRNV